MAAFDWDRARQEQIRADRGVLPIWFDNFESDLSTSEPRPLITRDSKPCGVRAAPRRATGTPPRAGELGSESLTPIEALLAAVRAAPGEDLLSSPNQKLKLRELVAKPAKRSASGRPNGGETNLRRQEQLSPEQTTAIGLSGEVAAYAWLARRYPTFSPACWRSSFAAIDGIPDSDDQRGYDFEVPLASGKTLFLEVKASRRT